MHNARSLSIALPLLAGARPAHADDREAAQAAFREGSRLYTVGDYRLALDRFKASFVSLATPETLFSIAQCQRHLGNHEEALRLYKLYLEMSPNGDDRAEVERLIVEEGRVFAAPKAPAAQQQQQHAEPPRRSWLWAVLVGGVVLIGAAVAVTLAATLTHEAPDPTTSAGVATIRFP